ncbi:AsnC family transcriptional regulator [Pedobacter lusitanus]|uniref:AsnC family transcriptional regulator n=1 Tax=Pedobacter lusitanus TaxID=1503925 RepID=A0A0D0GL02_9SPHI|nr:Lrp/AsnC family transcriptional regulator [Pedobacter lusitanus]KIO77867.1 AsnC family transcriptional regulator [Pedobacter lusitanus]
MRLKSSLSQFNPDDLDLKILEILQSDNSTPQRIIGEAVNLSAAAVQRRIKRMEEAGTIQFNIAAVNPLKVGRLITLIVEISMESEKLQQVDSMKKRFSEQPEIQQCYYVTGGADFVLILTVKDMSDYESFTRRVFFSDPNIKKFKTLVTIDRVKVGLSVPLNI